MHNSRNFIEISSQPRNAEGGDYYHEVLFHILLSGGQDLKFWTPTPNISTAMTFSESLWEFDRVTGFSGRHSYGVTRPVPWKQVQDYQVSLTVRILYCQERFQPIVRFGDSLLR